MAKSTNQQVDFTVVIPTYNGANRLPIVLEKLYQQSGIEHLNWEIIIIDNNSSDHTFQVFQDYQEKSPSNCTLSYFLEPEQGESFARMLGIKESLGDLVAFVDDDNIPALDWIWQSYSFGKQHPQAGAWSGQIHGEFEVNPPENFQQIQAFLAIREHGDQPFIFEASNLKLPPGASLVVRKQAWCESVPQKLTLIGRKGKSLVGGEDIEALLYIHKAGWEIWYHPAMHVYHQMPYWRVEEQYLLSLALSSGLCTFQLRLVNAKVSQIPVILTKTFLGSLSRIILHFIKYKGNFQHNLIANFEVRFYLGMMISPFYALNLYLRRHIVT